MLWGLPGFESLGHDQPSSLYSELGHCYMIFWSVPTPRPLPSRHAFNVPR
jgi:hypothetical protein